MAREQCFLPNKSSKLVPRFVRPLLATKLTEERQVRARAHLSPLWPQPDVRMVHRDFLLLPAHDCPPARERWEPPGSLTDRASAHRDPAGAPCLGRLIFNENKTLRTLVSKCNRQLCILNGSLQSLLQDGRQEPRGGRLDRRLPNPRAMSKKNHPDENKPDTRYTHMVMQFGQFLDHDLTLTPKDGRFWHFGTLKNNIEQKYRRVSPVLSRCVMTWACLLHLNGFDISHFLWAETGCRIRHCPFHTRQGQGWLRLDIIQSSI